MRQENEALTVEDYLESLRRNREEGALIVESPVETVLMAPAEVATLHASEASVAVSTPPVATELPALCETTEISASSSALDNAPEATAASPNSIEAPERVIVRRAGSVPVHADNAKPKRTRRRVRSGLASRIIMGMSLVLAVSLPVASTSLWGNNATSIYTQPDRVFKNGDIITIVVNEATTADHKWNSERDKQWQVTGTASDPGAGAGTKNLFARFFPFMGLDYQSQLKTDNKSDRSTSLKSTVAAEVVNVMPNGNLQIVARKVTRVNSEEQTIELTGNIRPADVSVGNVVSSDAIADANIKVNGTLRYSNDTNPSPLERVFSFISGLFL